MAETEPTDPGTTRVVHRVHYLPDDLREAVRVRRSDLGQSVRAFVADAVTHELDPLVRTLAELGLAGRPEAGVRPARLPLSEESLEALRRAGERVGLPAGRLLLLCLARSAARKRRRHGQSIATTEASGATRRGRLANKAKGPQGPGRPRGRAMTPIEVTAAPADPNTPED